MKKTMRILLGLMLCLCLTGCAAHGHSVSEPVSASQSTPPTLGQHTASTAEPTQAADESEPVEAAEPAGEDSTEPQTPTAETESPSAQTVAPVENANSATKTAKSNEKADKSSTKSNQSTDSNTASQPAAKPDTAAPVMTGYLPRGDAIQIAVNHAGVKQADIWDLSCKLEEEDGVMIYQVEFEHGQYEYEYEIDAKTGKILDVEIDD